MWSLKKRGVLDQSEACSASWGKKFQLSKLLWSMRNFGLWHKNFKAKAIWPLLTKRLNINTFRFLITLIFAHITYFFWTWIDLNLIGNLVKNLIGNLAILSSDWILRFLHRAWDQIFFILFQVHIYCIGTRVKSLLESLVTTFLPDWQPPLLFVWFTSKSHQHY